MNITIIRDSILKILQNANLFTSFKINDIKVLRGLLITVKKDGIILNTTNINEYYQGEAGGKVEKEGQVLVDFKTFFELVKNLQEVKINMEKKQNSLVLSSSMGKVKLPLLDVSEFLTLKKEVTGIEINKNLFNFSKLRQVVFSSSSDESRPVLTGICFDFLENETKIVGTDGFRLSLETIKTKSGDTSLDRIIVSGKSIISLAKVFGNKLEKVLYDNSEKQLMFFGEENTVAVRLLEGEFPPYDKVIPKQAKTSIVFKRKDLINSLKTASLFAKEGSNMLLVEIVDKNLIISSSNASTGEAEFKTPLISKEGENNKITFNYKYLLDFLNIIEEKEITFEMTNSFAPGVFKKASNNDYLHIIMPIRSQE